MLDQRAQRVAVRGDEHQAAEAQVRAPARRTSTAASGARRRLRHSVRGTMSEQAPRSAGRRPATTRSSSGSGGGGSSYDRRQRMNCSVAELRPRRRLVLALQRAVVPLVQPPGPAHRDPGPVGGVQRQLGGPDGAALQRGVHDVRQQPGLAQQLAAAARLGSPFSVRPTSTQPVKRFFAFHSLSPCRSSTRVRRHVVRQMPRAAAGQLDEGRRGCASCGRCRPRRAASARARGGFAGCSGRARRPSRTPRTASWSGAMSAASSSPDRRRRRFGERGARRRPGAAGSPPPPGTGSRRATPASCPPVRITTGVSTPKRSSTTSTRPPRRPLRPSERSVEPSDDVAALHVRPDVGEAGRRPAPPAAPAWRPC